MLISRNYDVGIFFEVERSEACKFNGGGRIIRIRFIKGNLQKFLCESIFDFFLDFGVKKQVDEVNGIYPDILEWNMFPSQKLKESLFNFIKFLSRLHNKKCKIRIPLIFSFPIFKWFYIFLFVHVFTRFSYFLIVDDIDVGTFLILLLNPPRYFLKPLRYQILILLLLIPIGQQCNFFIVQKIKDIVISSFPLNFVDCLQNDPIFTVRNKDGISELFILHALEECYIADGCF